MGRSDNSPSSRASRAIVPAALIAVGAAWLVHFLRIFATSPPAAAPAPMVAPGSGVATELPALAPQRAPLAEPTKPVVSRLLVVDETHAPVANARALRWPEAARAVPAAQASVLAETAADGVLELPGRSDGRCIAICADGFASAWAEDAEPVNDTLARLTLRRGRELLVLCSDLQGQPLAGVDVVVSRAAGLSRYEPTADEPELASPDAAVATHRGRSGGDGRVVIAGLSEGVYGFWATSPGYVPVRGYEGGGTVTIPAPAQSLTFARATAAVVQAPGEVIGSSTAPRTGKGVMTGARTRAMERERRLLQARFPGALVFIASEGDGDAAWQPVECRFIVAHKGLYVASVPLRPVTEICEPTVLAADTLVEPMQFGYATCAVVDISGQPYDLIAPWVSPGSLSNWRRPSGGPIKLGMSTLLPVGTYQLTSLDPVEQEVLRGSPSFVVSAQGSAQHVVELKVPLRRCRVRAELAGGNACDLFLLDAQCRQLPSLSQTRSLVGGAAGQLIALPCASVDVEASAFGCDAISRRLVVEPGRDELALTLVFGGGS